ncbi:tRNA-dihydrouridine synthase [bacterium]|nr:tRNA-dihydrouridine synthase [bacterium]
MYQISPKLSKLGLKSQVSSAPMAGITDLVLRQIIRSYNSDVLLTSEMISSEALKINKNCNVIDTDDLQSPVAFQISGHKPDVMTIAAKYLEDRADFIDINMGCPVNKVVCGGDGSALMKTPELAYNIVKEVKKNISKPVSVKIRLGYTFDTMNYIEFSQLMQEAGASLITIHARTRKQMYSGSADWGKIADLMKEIDIPVFANGDINSIDSATECLEISKADGIAIGRGVLSDLSLPHRIDTFLKTGKKLPEPTLAQKIECLKKHLNNEITYRGENVGIKFFRKFYPYYISKTRNASALRGLLVIEENYNRIMEILGEINCG